MSVQGGWLGVRLPNSAALAAASGIPGCCYSSLCPAAALRRDTALPGPISLSRLSACIALLLVMDRPDKPGGIVPAWSSRGLRHSHRPCSANLVEDAASRQSETLPCSLSHVLSPHLPSPVPLQPTCCCRARGGSADLLAPAGCAHHQGPDGDSSPPSQRVQGARRGRHGPDAAHVQAGLRAVALLRAARQHGCQPWGAPSLVQSCRLSMVPQQFRR